MHLRRNRKTMRPLFFVIGLITCAGCATGLRRGEPLRRPVIVSTPAEARGQWVYMRHCYSCHQAGEGGLAPALNLPLPALAIRTQVRLGAGAMPAFPSNVISDAELDDLILYMKLQRRS